MIEEELTLLLHDYGKEDREFLEDVIKQKYLSHSFIGWYQTTTFKL